MYLWGVSSTAVDESYFSLWKSITRTGHKQKFSPQRRDGSVGVGRKAIIANVGDCGLRHSGSTYRQVLLPPSADFPPRRGGFLPHLRCSARICIYKKPWFSKDWDKRTKLHFPKRTAVKLLTQFHCPLGGLKKSCRFSSIVTFIKLQLCLAESKN